MDNDDKNMLIILTGFTLLAAVLVVNFIINYQGYLIWKTN